MFVSLTEIRLLDLLDECNNAPAGTDWARWKSKYKKRSPLYGDLIEYFRASSYEQVKPRKIIHNVIDEPDKSLCWTPLHWACSTGARNSIKILTSYGADPFVLSNLGFNILHAAAESKAPGGLEDALKISTRYPDRLNINHPNWWGETPLHIAAWGSVENVRSLLKANADRNCMQMEGLVPLHCAGMTAKGDARRRIIDLLCTGSTEHLNVQDVEGRSPLFDFLDDPTCVEMLFNYGADLQLLDKTGKSVFHHACILGHEETLGKLLQLSHPDSVVMTIKDHDGNTALILALKHGNKSCALKLLEHHNNVGDVVGQGGWAMAHYAAEIGDPVLLEKVLSHPGHVRGTKTIDGKSAEMVAMESGTFSGEVKRLLRKYDSFV